jgi:hypothetical protein
VAGLPLLPARHTSQASFVLPGGRRSHPFRSHRAGYADDLREWVTGPEHTALFGVEIGETFERSLHGGTLRIAAVRQRLPRGDDRDVVFAVWEHAHGSIVTSRHGNDLGVVARRLLSLPFRAEQEGCSLALDVDVTLRAPMVVTHVPSLGVCFVLPHTKSLLARVPRAPGFRAAGGELYRARADRRSLLLVTGSAVVDIEPTADAIDPIAVAQSVQIEWEDTQ